MQGVGPERAKQEPPGGVAGESPEAGRPGLRCLIALEAGQGGDDALTGDGDGGRSSSRSKRERRLAADPLEQDVVLEAERRARDVGADAEPSLPVRKHIPGGVPRVLIPVGQPEPVGHRLVHVGDARALQQIADLPSTVGNRVLPVNAEHDERAGTRNPVKLGQPEVLKALVDVGEHAVVENKIELTVDIVRRWFGPVDRETRVGQRLPTPGDGLRIDVGAMQLDGFCDVPTPDQHATTATTEVERSREGLEAAADNRERPSQLRDGLMPGSVEGREVATAGDPEDEPFRGGGLIRIGGHGAALHGAMLKHLGCARAAGTAGKSVVSILWVMPAGWRHATASRFIAAAVLVVMLGLGLVLTGLARGRAGSGHIPSARTFAGVPRIGALYTSAGASQHTCTASVVDSPDHNTLITAAHCVHGTGAGVVFVPGAYDRQAPFGRWRVTSVDIDREWETRQDPRADVAFLTVAPREIAGVSTEIQTLTGGYRLGSTARAGERVTVSGYPASSSDAPITCSATVYLTDRFPTFDCHGFVGGTSGSPWLLRTSHGEQVVGIIGGLNQGGCHEYTSYSSPLDRRLHDTFDRAATSVLGDSVPRADSSGC